MTLQVLSENLVVALPRVVFVRRGGLTPMPIVGTGARATKTFFQQFCFMLLLFTLIFMPPFVFPQLRQLFVLGLALPLGVVVNRHRNGDVGEHERSKAQHSETWPTCPVPEHHEGQGKKGGTKQCHRFPGAGKWTSPNRPAISPSRPESS